MNREDLIEEIYQWSDEKFYKEFGCWVEVVTIRQKERFQAELQKIWENRKRYKFLETNEPFEDNTMLLFFDPNKIKEYSLHDFETIIDKITYSTTINDPMLEEVVSLQTAQRLKRRGWALGQTEIRYAKEAKSSVYHKVRKSRYVIIGCDAPNYYELKQMCYAVGLVGIEDMPVEHLAERLISYVYRHKIKLSDYEIC